MTALERTGWRDQEFSNHRRLWGENLPCCNFDSFGLDDDLSEDGQRSFLVWEYDLLLPRVLIEYKHYLGENLTHYLQTANGVAMNNIACAARLPFLAVTYWPTTWAMHVVRVNESARRLFHCDGYMSEYAFVRGLYRERNRPMPEVVAERLSRALPMIEGKQWTASSR